MQKFNDIKIDDLVSESRVTILERDEAVVSNFAGEDFPTKHLHKGMFCFRTDLNKIYILEDKKNSNWKLSFDLNKSSTNKEYIDDITSGIKTKQAEIIGFLTKQIEKNTEQLNKQQIEIIKLKRHKPNILANEVDGIEIRDSKVGDELVFWDGKITNKKRFMQENQPDNAQEGDWWVKQ